MSKGILLVNLGSPDSPAVPDVRRYLNEFLMDERVIDVNWLIRRLVVGIILINRPKESGHAYESIWTKEGSPLVVTSQHVREKLQARLDIPVELAMRYQNPSIPDVVQKLANKGVDELFLIPLFPHYAMSSYETAVVRVKEVAASIAPKMKVVVQPPYFDAPDYIHALAENTRPWLDTGYDYLLFSFHGIPERHVQKTDPGCDHCLKVKDCCNVPNETHAFCYKHQCVTTANKVVKALGIPDSKWSISFQSRLGRDPWLKPYSDFEFERLAKEGIRKLLVISPAFVADCLETIEELGIRGKESFVEAGGKDFAQIPCLNENPLWIDTLERMSRDFLAGRIQSMPLSPTA